MTYFGSGIALDADNPDYAWDIEVDGTGDIAATRDIDELEKDVAFNIARQINNAIGFQPTPKYLKQIEVATRRIILNDSRIDRIRFIDVWTENETLYLEIGTVAHGEEQDFELVIEV